MDYEKKYKEALNWMRIIYPTLAGSDKEDAEHYFPELAESEDERIRKWVFNLVDNMSYENLTASEATKNEEWKRKVLAYLEKQKEQKKSLSERFRPDFPKVADFIESIDDMEKNRAIEILEDYLKWAVSMEGECLYTWNELADAIRLGIDAMKEKKPNIELIQKSWYMEGYHDRKFNKEPKWIINTGEGGPWYEENPKYGQVIEETPKVKDPFDNEQFCRGYEAGKHDAEREREINTQKPVEWSEEDRKNLELVIDCIYDLYPDPVMKYKLKDWLKNLPERFNLEPKTEWSEEDEDVINGAIGILLDDNEPNFVFPKHSKLSVGEIVKRLKSLRPSWKPSEDEERLINTSISFLKDFADKGYENAVECIDWLKSKLNGTSTDAK